MTDNKPSDTPHDGGYFTSEGCDLLEIREEDTQPGTVSDSYRKYLREKYGRKEPPPNGPADENGPAQQP